MALPIGRVDLAGRARLDEMLEHRMVPGETLDPCAAHEIGSAVADVSHVQVVRQDDGRRRRRSHAGELGRLHGAGPDPVVRDAEGLEQTLSQPVRQPVAVAGATPRPAETR